MSALVVTDILNSLNREVLNQLDLAGSIDHPGENGRAREHIIAGFLRRLLPREFAIDTGFVFDATGGISKQVDLVIHRTGYHPVFEIGGIKHFMVESVAAVLENKARIGSVEVLHRALENIRSVKGLDRTNGGTNYIVRASVQGPPVDPDDFQHQIFGAIVTEMSLSEEVLKDALLEFLRAQTDRRTWFNMYVDVRRVSVRYLKGSPTPTGVTVVPREAAHLSIAEPIKDSSILPPLIELAFELVNFLRIAPVVDFKPTSYFRGQFGKGRSWEI